MLYSILKVFVRAGMKIFCRSITVNKPELLQTNGPLLLAANHPNSFLDAILLDILFEEPIWSLARGDVFRKKWVSRLLYRLHMFPVYRVSEGVENLEANYDTFERSKAVFRRNGLVLIFSEGKCINEWHLRPLKKGTARLSLSSWSENIPLRVLPVGINYSSFRLFGKNVFINFGRFIDATAVHAGSEGARIAHFNELLRQQLMQLVYEIDTTDVDRKNSLLTTTVPRWYQWLLTIPGAVGWLVHLPVYVPVQRMVFRKTHDNDHYDSILAAVLLLIYPIYLLLLTALLYRFTGSPLSVALPVTLPFCAWAWVRISKQVH